MNVVRGRATLALALLFAAAAARAQTAVDPDLERRFDEALRAEDLDTWMQRLTAHPHHLGSDWGHKNADFIAEQLRSFGWDTRIEEFSVLYPTPKTRLLEMIAPTRFTAALQEPPMPGDPTSSQAAEQLPVFNVYSPDGDVTGELVYVNYGVPADYQELALRGVSVKGRVVIARYGGSWRGIKPKVAAEHGAVGCLIYSDPRDDGYFEGDVYPKGAWRPEQGAQRGSVADMPVHPGDPLTPGIGSTPGAKRLALKDAETIARIPVMPISYGDALPLLRALEGPIAPEAWRGALPITYHLGAGPTRVHLKLLFDWKQAIARDVIATLPGRERPDEWIVRGNHHDAWVNGADDPTSGQVAMMEEARALGALHKAGWSPRRTLVYAAWDGEEPGLIGSTEWVETHADELRAKAVAYVNTDNTGRGFLSAAGSHTLEPLVNAAARDVLDPQTGVSVLDRLRARRIVDGPAEERDEARAGGDLRIGALGSGSDYTPFLQHLGIASLNLGFGGENGGGQYHSIYDSYSHYSRFGDPGFKYGIALAKVAGRVVLRLADAETVPLSFTAFSKTASRYVREVSVLADDMRRDTDEQNRKLKERSLALAADPHDGRVLPAVQDPVPFLSFAPLQNASARLEQAARRYDDARAARKEPLSLDAQRALDAVMLHAESSLTRPAGLPRRPWFTHEVYAPGYYTGYGVKTLPGVREAIEQRSWKEAEEHVGLAAAALDAFGAEVDKATAIVARP